MPPLIIMMIIEWHVTMLVFELKILYSTILPFFGILELEYGILFISKLADPKYLHGPPRIEVWDYPHPYLGEFKCRLSVSGPSISKYNGLTYVNDG